MMRQTILLLNQRLLYQVKQRGLDYKRIDRLEFLGKFENIKEI